jgi:hypothetical protein
MNHPELTDVVVRTARAAVLIFVMTELWILPVAGQTPSTQPTDSSSPLQHASPQLALNRCNECHASSVVQAPAWQRSSRVWFERDPHARAYTKLLNSESQRIIAQLMGSAIEVDTSEYRQVLRERCVSCHANEQASDDQIKLGIDCQVCHGPATAWGDEHYSQSTLSLGDHRFDHSQRVNLESIEQRARLCSDCHVGQLNRGPGLKDREVDHRLMAAGHPTMYFDFENYLDRYPKHWDQAEEDQRLGPFSSYSRWRTGKWVAAHARLQLLHDRADRAERAERVESSSLQGIRGQHDWPEFTESSCTSCHFSLLPDSWRRRFRSSSTATWDDWYLESIDIAFPKTTDAAWSRRWSEDVLALRSTMEARSPDPATVRHHANALMELCQVAVEARENSDEQMIRARLKRLIENESSVTSWEQGAQWANTAHVLADSLGWKLPHAPIDGNSERFFPKGIFFDSPRPWDPIAGSPTFDGAPWFQPETLSSYREFLQLRLGSKP